MKPRLPKITFWRVIAAVILVLGAWGAYVRFFRGLGAATGLSDAFPWGLWIGFDVLVGVGLAAGGFTVAATVHIFNLEKYESISRPSLLTAFLGYLLVCAALVFDIGHPLRLWHPLIMWNPRSVMFEVAWCVTLYTTVLALEFSPLVFERLGWNLPLKLVRAIYIPLVIAGVLLSTLHQSSLGTVYVIVPDKLYGLWYTPLLPVFFFLSAIAAGLAMTIVESFLSARAFRKRLETEVLSGLGRVLVVLLAVYLVWRLMNMAHLGNLHLAFAFTPWSVLFWVEIGIGAILPMCILFFSGERIKDESLFFSALLVVIGFVLNRLNVSITGMLNAESYFPKWTELIVTLSMVTAGFVIFGLAVRFLPIFPEDVEPAIKAHYSPLPMRALAGLWVILIGGIAAYAYAPVLKVGAGAVHPVFNRFVDPFKGGLAQIPPDGIILTNGDSPGQVNFSHSDHLDFQDRPDCRVCHSELFSFRLDPAVGEPKGEEWHERRACGACHDGKEAFSTGGRCRKCHDEK